MPNSALTEKEIAGNLLDMLTGFDDNAAAELEILNGFLRIKSYQSTVRKPIVENKFGKASDEMVALESMTITDNELIKAVESEILVAKTTNPSFIASDWRIQGFAYNSKGEKSSGVKIMLINEETNEPVKKVKPVVSGDNGFYSITVKAETVRTLSDAILALAIVLKDQDPYIAVSNIRVIAGQIDHGDVWPEI